MQLGYLPRLEIRHTSEQEIGQVYVPRINSALLVAVIILVLGFRSSDNLGAAYGIAVSGMMAITTGLAFLYMRSRGLEPRRRAAGLCRLRHHRPDLSQRQSVEDRRGRLVPDRRRRVVFTIMATWWRGRRVLAELRGRDAMPLRQFVEALKPERPARDPGNGDLYDARPERVSRSRCCMR